MMEGMNETPTGEEEYILAMRSTAHRDDSDQWRERRSDPLQPGAPNLWPRRRTKTKGLIPMTEDHTTKVLASLVPDEIIYNCNDYSNRPYDICLLFGDVSGFTDLCEIYNKPGMGGPSRLTVVLNDYIGSMVQEIMSHNGDVMKFSGDAFLAMWKRGVNDSMQDIVHEALDSAIMIQKTFGTYETDVGVFLRVKLAISAGFIMFSIIGDQKMSHYVVVGLPIQEVKNAEKKASAGEIVLSYSAWHLINPNEYTSHQVGDGIHTKVTGFGTNWRPTQRNVEKIQKHDQEHDCSPSISVKGLADDDNISLFDLPIMTGSQKNIKNDDFSVRPSVNYASIMNLKDDLAKFIIPPVKRGIDLDEPLEYLTEMRQIVIMFINVIPIPNIDIPSYITLIDTTYKNVCSVAHEMQGCVNKLSIFDKDLMLVLLFGLRGYKSEFESQNGLRCASECYHAISGLVGVTSTSIAVTTGVTYCGVVGHTLRREYTVIGASVNKAARLMCAYPNKVTCDRETFLHSKLQSKNFILQEPKPLKGIINVGPVYEFKEQLLVTQDTPVINPYPILGRLDELKLYRRLLDECVEINKSNKTNANASLSLNYHNMLLIHGSARVGKTRLLDECVLCTPSTIPVNRFTLTKRNSKKPYQTIQQILTKPLGLTDLSSAEERESKLKLRLQKIKVPDFLCALNKVFNVHFEKSNLYISLSNQQKTVALQQVLKQLCYIGFITLWVIAIDDAEFIDQESWNYLHILLELDVTFIVMTMSSKEIHTNAEFITSHRKVRHLDLRPIDKWYHAGLVCQILEVEAIPPELEKLIQSRSMGNPGWIESFLVSLIQAGGILIQNRSEHDINELGLVSPPLDMLVRLTAEELLELENPTSDTVIGSVDEKAKQDHWKMYQFSYRDSVINFMKEKIIEKRTKYGKLTPVCIVSPSFKLADIDAEISMDVMIVKMFDSLTSQEQMLLKCSSVLGEYFPRDMLIYVMAATSASRSTALAVAKLFELRVLACAQGDFSQGDTAMVYTQRLLNPNHEIGIRCDCRGIKIDENCVDLPKYASCGYLRFRLTMFRDTTYNLLTDNQRKEFHSRAIKYLEKETKRCRSCGHGIFVRILGTRNDEGFIRKVKKFSVGVQRSRSQSTNSNSERASQDLSYLSAASSNYSSFSASNRSITHHLLRKDTVGSMKHVMGDLESQHTKTNYALEKFQPLFCSGLNVKKNLNNYSLFLTRTFSYADFTSCQCPQILTTMYTQMLEHCKGAVETEKMMDAMLEYAYICIISYNVPQAMKILEEAAAVIDEQAASNNGEDEELGWKIPLLRGKVVTLIGHARLELGQLEEAYLCFQRALKHYGYTFPAKSISIKLHTYKYELKHRLGMFCCPSLFIDTASGSDAEFCDDLSECLSQLCNLFKDVQMWQHAELAATWSLNKSLASDMDFYGLCTAYSNMLEVCHHLGKENLCMALELHALKLCHRKKSSIEAQELKAVAMLYGAIFCSRLMRSEVERAIYIGNIMLKICATVHAIQTSLQVLPLIVHALLIKCQISDTVTMIMELEYCAEEDTDNSGRTWFYAVCVSLQLESGFTLVPYRKCEKFYQVEGDTLVNIRDPDAERRYYTVMWLWCVRNEEWETATVWYTKACDFHMIKKDDSLSNIFTALYHLEGLLLHLVGKINKRNIDAIVQAYEEINTLINAIESVSQIAKIILPRFYHLKAYYKFIQNDETKAFKLLNNAKLIAKKQENSLEFEWAEHSEKAWNNNLPATAVDFWKEHCEPDNLIDYHEVDFNDGKLGLFTLPMPTYY